MQSLIGVLRVLVELFKIMTVILILNGVNSYDCNTMLINLGDIRFSVLVQEIFSMALFIPILALGRLIFYGFSIRKFSNVFDHCISVHSGQHSFITRSYSSFMQLKGQKQLSTIIKISDEDLWSLPESNIEELFEKRIEELFQDISSSNDFEVLSNNQLIEPLLQPQNQISLI